MSAIEEALQNLSVLLAELSYREGEFTLASGKKSDFYVDVRQTVMKPAGALLIGRLLWQRLENAGINSVGGMAVGAVPLVTSVLCAAASANRAEAIDGFFVRKTAKDHGTARRIDGRFDAGAKIALVEDVVTTGASTLEAIDAVEEAGGRVQLVISVVDREESEGIGRLSNRVESAEALVTRTMILEAHRLMNS